MSQEEVINALHNAIHEVQSLNGTDLKELNDQTIPRDNIVGFDSLCEIIALTVFERIVKVDLGPQNIFVGPQNKSLKLNEVADTLMVKINKIKRRERKTK
jgi:hypothetical protein